MRAYLGSPTLARSVSSMSTGSRTRQHGEVFAAVPVTFQASLQWVPSTLEVAPALITEGDGNGGAGFVTARALLRFGRETTLNLATGSPLDDCLRYDSRSLSEVGLGVREVDWNGQPTIRMQARDHSACVFFPIEPFERGSDYRLRFWYRTLSGSRARVCLWQQGPDHCADLPTLRLSPEWQRFDATVTPTVDTIGLRLFVYADGSGDALTVTDYRKLTFAPLLSTVLLGRPSWTRLPQIIYRRVSPSEFTARVVGTTDRLLVVAERQGPAGRCVLGGRDSSDLSHVTVNGYANGWLIPWKGSYELKIFYAPERYTRLARWFGLSRHASRRGVAARWASKNARTFVLSTLRVGRMSRRGRRDPPDGL